MLLALFFACAADPASGTAVGNPGTAGSLDVVLSDVPDGLELRVADATIDSFSLKDCEGGEQPVAVDDVWSALEGTADGGEVPGGPWCGLTLSFSSDPEALYLEGETDGGTAFDVALDLSPLTFSGSFFMDGDALLLSLSLSGTLDAEALEAEGDEVSIDAEDERSVAWASDLRAHSELWQDLDEDQAVGDADQEIQASGDGAYALSDTSAGCGCSSGGRRGGWLGLLGLLLILRGRARPQGATGSRRS